jgi:hypothetical protein
LKTGLEVRFGGRVQFTKKIILGIRVEVPIIYIMSTNSLSIKPQGANVPGL